MRLVAESRGESATAQSSTRAVSTALDVALAAVIVGGAVVVLAGVGATPAQERGTDAADATADRLATTTLAVNYSLAPGIAHAAASDTVATGRVGDPALERHAHGTAAALLARAAVENAALDGVELSRSDDDFTRAVRAAVSERVAADATRVRVRAVWRPYPGSPLSGSVAVGDPPPDAVTVHAATVAVPAPVPATRSRALTVADDGFDAVAAVVANRTVRGMFGYESAWLALRSDGPTSTLVTYRYRRAASLLDVSVADSVTTGDVAAANDRLAGALAARLERDMRQQFASPRAAARQVSTGVVVVTVRTWSP